MTIDYNHPNTSSHQSSPIGLLSLLRRPTQKEIQQSTLSHPVLGNLARASSINVLSNQSFQFSSNQIQSLIDQQQSHLVDLEESIAQSTSNLKQQLLTQLESVRQNRGVLDEIPQRIDKVEDEFLQLCSDLNGDEDGDQPTSGGEDQGDRKGNGKESLMKSLESQIQTLNSIKKAKDYFSLLSRAQELHDEVLNPKTSIESSLEGLSHLSQLVNQVESLWSESSSSDSSKPKLKALEYLKSQRNSALTSLRDSKLKELSQALESANWPPSLNTKESDQSKGEIYKGKLKDNEAVRKSWKEICQVQKKAQSLDLMPLASILIRKDSSSTSHHSATSSISEKGKGSGKTPLPGSDEYVPILAIQALLSPLLLRFRFHFDSERNTNRLDKPEWYLTHILNLIKSQSSLFQPISGDVARLCSRGGFGSEIDLTKELLHGLLLVLRTKLKSSLGLLLEHPSLLAHTVLETLKFDEELKLEYTPSRNGCISISDEILGNEKYFEKWLEGERLFSEERFDEILENSNAWIITKDGMDDEEQSTWSNLISGMGIESDSSNDDANGNQDSKADSSSTSPSPNNNETPTTKSARNLIELLESITERHSSLPSLKQKIAFITRIQLPLLRSYLSRLSKSLDAFESLSSAFSRAIPGGIDSTGITSNSDSDMVKGLRGLGRLLKALLSSNHISISLRKWSESLIFLDLSDEMRNSKLQIEGGGGEDWTQEFKKLEDEEDDKELREASLASLLRRGLRSGTGAVTSLRPLGGGGSNKSTTFTSNRVTNQEKMDQINKEESKEVDSILQDEDDSFDERLSLPSVWDETMKRFQQIEKRAARGIEKLCISEVSEVMREYSQSSWDDETKSTGPISPTDDDFSNEIGMFQDEVPTKSLIPSLSILSTHLSHFAPILPIDIRLPIYRNVAKELSNAVVEKVIIAGGSRRFDYKGSVRFSSDVSEGWLGVISEVLRAPAGSSNSTLRNRSLLFGKRPQAPWKHLRDAASLLSLPASVSNSSTTTNKTDQTEWTLSKATRAVFDEDPEDDVRGWRALKRDLELDEDLDVRIAREVLRRRVECWK